MEPRRTPYCQCANNFESRREMRAIQVSPAVDDRAAFCTFDTPKGPVSGPVDAYRDITPSDNTAPNITASPGSSD
jgi:hypothetical protein